MEIRLSNVYDDFDGIMNGAKDFISRIKCKEAVPDNDQDLERAVLRILSITGTELVVAEHGGNIVGGIGMLYGPAIWRPDVMSATELFWWVDANAPHTTALRLIRFVQDRARAHGAIIGEFMCLETSPNSIRKVYASMGLSKAQETWYGELC